MKKKMRRALSESKLTDHFGRRRRRVPRCAVGSESYLGATDSKKLTK